MFDLSTLWLDTRHAVRALASSARISTLVVILLGLGIGANTALFGIANAVFVRPLPYRDAASLVTLWETRAADSAAHVPASPPDFLDWQSQSRTVHQLSAYRPWGFVMTGTGDPERLIGARISASLLPLLGVEAVLGRAFLPEEDRFGAEKVVLLGESFWQRRFAGNPQLPGTSIVLNNDAYRIVGVVPRFFRLPEAEVYVPLALEPFALRQRGSRALTVIGRLATGTTIDQARSELSTIAAAIERRFPDSNAGWTVTVVPLTTHLVGGVRVTVALAWGAVAIVLLIAGLNAGNLLLARAGARRRAIAVNMALGATRRRIVRRLLTESVLLSLIAGGVGLLLALLGTRLFVTLAPASFPRLYDVRVDAASFGFALVAALLTGVIFGVVPAVRGSRPGAGFALNERAAIGGTSRSTLDGIALAFQVGLAVFVLVCAGLLVRSFRTVLAVDPGLDPAHVLALTISLPQPKYDDAARRLRFFQDLIQRVESTPGVLAGGVVSHLPLRGARLTGDFTIEGREDLGRGTPPIAEYVAVSEGFFRAMRIPLVEGRSFGDRDTLSAPPVVLVNETLARRFWPDGGAVGRRMVVGATLGADTRPREIVGVVRDVRSSSLEAEPQPAIYLPFLQTPWPTMTLVARMDGDPVRPAPALRSHVHAIDPNQPVTSILPVAQIVAGTLAPRRFQMLLVGVFAGLALILATLGVYGVAAYSVGLRTREFGVRAALGARRLEIFRLAVGRVLVSSAIGASLGLVAALVAARSLRATLFGVTPLDPLTFGLVPIVAATVVLAAAAIAGRRAAAVDPLIAMRCE